MISLVTYLALLLSQPPAATAPTLDESLRTELVQMEKTDQELRQATPIDVRAIVAADAAHTARMRQILDARGWPTIDLVGEDGAHAAWLLIQHADADPALQKRALGLMEPLLASGKVDRQNFAYLWDRVHVPQRYGTQGRCVSTTRWQPDTLESEAEVDERRKEMGMPPLAEYVAMASSMMCPKSRSGAK